MATEKINHLALAKEDLAIAESADAKREAYKRAAGHFAAYRDESPGEWRQTAASYCNTNVSTLDKLIRWHEAGYPEGTTPFTMADPGGSKPTDRAAISHAKKVLRENPEAAIEALAEAPEEKRRAALMTLAKGKETRDEFLSAGVAAIGTDREGRVPVPKRVKRQGALDAWGYLSSWAKQSEDRAKMALEKLRSVDERFPDDLCRDGLQSVEVTITAWELVRSTLKGKTVGDEAEAFLAANDN